MARAESFEIELRLDCATLGTREFHVIGTVEESGLFGPGEGYVKVTIDSAHVFLPKRTHKGDELPYERIDVTHLLDNISRVEIEEALEERYATYCAHRDAEPVYDFDGGPDAA